MASICAHIRTTLLIRRLQRTLKMAKMRKVQAVDVMQLMKRVRSHPILCDSRDDEYKLVDDKETDSMVWPEAPETVRGKGAG